MRLVQVSGRPKGEVLQMLTEKHAGVSKMIFVEDKLSTLEKVGKEQECHRARATRCESKLALKTS